MKDQTIEVLHKCKCLKEEVKVTVPARRGPAHDVSDWISTIVAGKISEDHEKRSPKCRRNIMEHVKIPVAPENDYLGEVK